MDQSIVQQAANIALLVVFAAMLLALLRLFRGPSLPDRVVALDLIGVLIAAATGLYSIKTGLSLYIEAALIIALVSFIGTAAFARYIEKGISQR